MSAASEQNQALLRAVVETSPLAICTLDTGGRITSWNPAAQAIFGWRPEEVLGLPLPLAEERRHADVVQRIQAALRGEGTQGWAVTGSRKDGARLQLQMWCAPLREQDGAISGVLVMFDDVTERKWLEEQLRQAQKMEALGRLAGGVAHDFSNLLTIISGYAEMMLPYLEGHLRDDAKAILEGTERAAALTRQLLALGRRQPGEPRVVDLNGIIAGMEKILRRALGDDIVLEVSLRPSLWPVKADPAQLEQVLLNLAVNARDAMPRGGRLVIATANSGRAEASALGLPAADYVRLTVRDTGEGMSPEACRHVFEPFFSTKPQGKGTGLGLAIVYGIIKQSGGEIFVDSRLGEGTLFTIFLPRARGVPETVRPHPATPPPAGSRETVLLVEDEDAVRRLVAQMLTRQGYTVLQASSGEEALRIWDREGQRVDLLLTDVVMPGMSGRELAQRLAAGRPGLKVVYMSGYTGDALGEHGVAEGDVVLIQKPFTPRTLLRRLREVIAGTNKRA